MGQRYTPSQLLLLIDDDSTLALYPPVAAALAAAEYNTLLVAAEFSTAGANCVVKPWVNIRSKDNADVTQDNWLPLDPVTLTAEAATANPPPVFSSGERAPPEEVPIPNCHSVVLELISISAGDVNLWAAPTNRAPR